MKNQNSLKWIIKNSKGEIPKIDYIKHIKYITGIGGNCFGTCK